MSGGRRGLSCLPKISFILVRSGIIFYCFYFGRIRIRNKALSWCLRRKWMKLNLNLCKIIVTTRWVRENYQSVNGRAASWPRQGLSPSRLSRTEMKRIIKTPFFDFQCKYKYAVSHSVLPPKRQHNGTLFMCYLNMANVMLPWM